MRSARTVKEPWSEEAEKSVLGGIFLMDAKGIKSISLILNPEDFRHSRHQEIYKGMMDLSTTGSAIDLVTLAAYFKDRGRLSEIGGAGYLAELSDSCPSAANIAHYIKIVKDKATLRRIVEGARDIAIQASQPGVDPAQISTRLSIETSHAAEVNQVSSTIKQLNKNIENGYPGLWPCYDLLTRTIRKVSPGHLWVVGAYTSIGKSAWLVDFICRLYRHGIENPGIAVFSTEMACEQYLLRMLSNHTKIPTWVITENSCNPDQTENLIKAQIFFSQRNLYLYDRLYKIEDIERTARMLKPHGLDIIAIDYIQNLWGEGSIYDRMSRLAPILQYLSKDLGITIIALSQVSNQFQREKGSSGVFGFKGAGEIAASADLGIELEKDPNIKERVVFKVVKNRHGRIGEGVLEYAYGYVKFHEVVEDGLEYGG